jgi:hypothetical protein
MPVPPIPNGHIAGISTCETTDLGSVSVAIRWLLTGECAGMAEHKYQKSQIATEQLKTAIFLFLNGGDPSSVITLAGAASVILERLLRNKGTTYPFIDFARNFPNVING